MANGEGYGETQDPFDTLSIPDAYKKFYRVRVIDFSTLVFLAVLIILLILYFYEVQVYRLNTLSEIELLGAIAEGTGFAALFMVEYKVLKQDVMDKSLRTPFLWITTFYVTGQEVHLRVRNINAGEATGCWAVHDGHIPMEWETDYTNFPNKVDITPFGFQWLKPLSLEVLRKHLNSSINITVGSGGSIPNQFTLELHKSDDQEFIRLEAKSKSIPQFLPKSVRMSNWFNSTKVLSDTENSV